MSGKNDQIALGWVREEVNKTLDKARQALEAFASNSDDLTQMRFCVSCLHQVRGTLQMLEFYGASLMAEELEHLGDSIVEAGSARKDKALEVLMQGIVQLPVYLERVQKGQKDIPMVLLPVLNEIRATRGESLLSESAVFTPNLANVEKRRKQVSDNKYRSEDELKQAAKKLRQHYQKGLLGILKNDNLRESFARLHKVLERLEMITAMDSVSPLWWIANGFLVVIREDRLFRNTSIHALLAQVERQIRAIGENGLSEVKKEVSPDLLKNLLYYIAKSKSKDKKVVELQQTFHLAEILPSEQQLEEHRSQMSGPDSTAIETVVSAIKDDLTNVKDNLDIFVRRQDNSPSDLEGLMTPLRQISDTLAMLGLGVPRDVIKQQLETLQELITEGVEPDDAVVMDIAGALLFVEASLSTFVNEHGRVPQQSTEGAIDESEKVEAAKRYQFDEAKVQLVNESRNNLQKSKDAIIDFMASSWDHRLIADVPKQLEEIKGGISMVGLDKPAELMDVCSKYIKNNLLAVHKIPDEKSLDALAEVLTSIEFFLEGTLEDKGIALDNVLAAAEESAEVLNVIIEQQPDIESAAEGAALSLDDSRAKSPIETPKPIVSSADVDEELIDDEVKEIFLEEAEEELESIREELPNWVNDQDNVDSLTTVRRSFHTLKGSGRLVGAEIIGELAWAIENMLNRVIDNTLDVSPPVIQTVNDARDMLPALIEAFRNQSTPACDSEELRLRALALSKGEAPPIVHKAEVIETAASLSDAPAALPMSDAESLSLDTLADASNEDNLTAFGDGKEQTSQTIEEADQVVTDIETPATLSLDEVMASNAEEAVNEEAVEVDASVDEGIDPVLMEIFSTEAQGHIVTINGFIDKAMNSPMMPKVSDPLVRALHTLKGSAHMAGVTPISEVVAPLESYFKEIKNRDAKISEDAMLLLTDSNKFLQETLQTLCSGGAISGIDNETFVKRGHELSSQLGEGAAVDTGSERDLELLSIFLSEGVEILNDADKYLNQWLEDETDKDKGNRLQAEMHTLKRGANMASLIEVERLAEQAEQYFSDGAVQAKLNGPYFELAKRALEQLHDMLDRAAADQDILSDGQLLQDLAQFDFNEKHDLSADAEDLLSTDSLSEYDADSGGEVSASDLAHDLQSELAALSNDEGVFNLDNGTDTLAHDAELDAELSDLNAELAAFEQHTDESDLSDGSASDDVLSQSAKDFTDSSALEEIEALSSGIEDDELLSELADNSPDSHTAATEALSLTPEDEGGESVGGVLDDAQGNLPDGMLNDISDASSLEEAENLSLMPENEADESASVSDVLDDVSGGSLLDEAEALSLTPDDEYTRSASADGVLDDVSGGVLNDVSDSSLLDEAEALSSEAEQSELPAGWVDSSLQEDTDGLLGDSDAADLLDEVESLLDGPGSGSASLVSAESDRLVDSQDGALSESGDDELGRLSELHDELSALSDELNENKDLIPEESHFTELADADDVVSVDTVAQTVQASDSPDLISEASSSDDAEDNDAVVYPVDEMMEIFIEEAEDIMDSLGETTHKWFTNLADTAAVAELQRNMHTLKGSARMAGADRIGELGHVLEDIYEAIVEGRLQSSPELVSVAEEVNDTLSDMVDALKSGRGVKNPQNLLVKIKRVASGEKPEDVEQDMGTLPTSTGANVKQSEIPADLTTDSEPRAQDTDSELDTLMAEMDTDDETLHSETEGVDIDSVDLEPEPDVSDVQQMADDKGRVDESDALSNFVPTTDIETPSAIETLAEETDLGANDASDMAIYELDELMEIFLEEAEEILDNIGETTAKWSSDINNVAAVAELQRDMHTLKGSARMAGAAYIGDLGHALEDIYEAIVDGKLKGTPDMVALAEDTHDYLMEMVKAVQNQQAVANPAPRIENIQGVASGKPTTVSLPEKVVSPKTAEPASEDHTASDIVAEVESPAAEAESRSVVRPSETVEFTQKEVPDSVPAPSIEAIISAQVDETVSLQVDAEDEEILDIYLEEANEILEQMDDTMQAWLQDPMNKEHIDLLQRNLHTLKGGARLSNINAIGDLTHEMESYFESIDSDSEVTSDIKEIMQEGQDVLARVIKQINDDRSMTYPHNLLARIKHSVRGETLPEAIETTASPLPLIPSSKIRREDDELEYDEPAQLAKVVPMKLKTRKQKEQDSKRESAAKSQQAPQEVVRVGSDTLENLVNLAGETSIFRSRLEQQVIELRSNLDEMGATVERLRTQLRNLEIETEAQVVYRREVSGFREYEDFDPLEMDRYNRQQELTRSLGESAADLLNLKDSLDSLASDSETLLLQQGRVNTELQERLMRTRMVPFTSIVPRLRRIVRQIGRELGKPVELSINAEGEMDRTILERMVAPIEHMLRNAIDHGIESPEKRQEVGKNETGKIKIKLFREGSEVVILVQDDGAGINHKAIRKKAIERGLINEDTSLTVHELQLLILEAGFSTAETVTQISGRGVGMDVVNSEIKQMGGVIDIESEYGAGTQFTVRLPFTVSVNQALMVMIGEEIFAIPLSSIEGIVRVSPFELQELYGQREPEYTYAGIEYQLKYLGGLIEHGKPVNFDGVTKPLPVLLLHGADKPIAVQVDDLMGSREIVVKSVGTQLSTVSGLSGATILGDGRVVLILDVLALLRLAESHVADMAGIEVASIERDTPLVMVVDDSITVRKVTARLLERHDFDVLTAKDGVDALTALQEHKPDVMLLDIEMPRMDGFELATIIRHDDKLKELPIIMITSRTGEKHRSRAEQIGVNHYMGKPFNESELLDTIQQLVHE